MRIILGSDIAHYTRRVGALDNRLGYIRALELLGHEVYVFVEVNPKRCRDPQNPSLGFSDWLAKSGFERLARQAGWWERCCLVYDQGPQTAGLRWDEACRIAAATDVLINISGKLRAPAILDPIPCRVFIDLAPAKTQVYHQEYHLDQGFDWHHYFYSVGRNVGQPGCDVPTAGVSWRPFWHPVVLDDWPSRVDPQTRRYTTITDWSGKETFHWAGQYSGEKSDNWLAYQELPARTNVELELAVRFADDTQADAARLRAQGWILSDPLRLTTPDEYRAFIQQSRGEFSVANQRYVQFQTGWFSDRTARYLASGKPVLVQSTGLESHLPVGQGLITFRTLDEAVEGLRRIEADYTQQARAARALAEEYVAADKVLDRLLREVSG